MCIPVESCAESPRKDTETNKQEHKRCNESSFCLCCPQTQSQWWLIDVWQAPKTICKTINSEPSSWKRYEFLTAYTEQELFYSLVSHIKQICVKEMMVEGVGEIEMVT